MNKDNAQSEKSELATEKMWETAQMLVDIAIKAQMKIYDVDRETARDWVIRAVEAVH
jgi:hypothetical protein